MNLLKLASLYDFLSDSMRFIIFFLCSLGCMLCHASTDQDKTIYGYVEKVTLADKQLTLPAKLDTGAKSASLSATKITKVTINGKPFLNFVVPSKRGDVLFQAPYVGDLHIKLRQKETELAPQLNGFVKRPVVMLRIKMGGRTQSIRVNLCDRQHFLYPLLLGRDAIILFGGIVDPSLKFMSKNEGRSRG